MLLHSENGLLVLHRPVGVKIPLEAHGPLGLLPHLRPSLPLLSQGIEVVCTHRTACRSDHPGIYGHAGFKGETQSTELFQKFMVDLLKGVFPNPFSEPAEDGMVRRRFAEGQTDEGLEG